MSFTCARCGQRKASIDALMRHRAEQHRDEYRKGKPDWRARKKSELEEAKENAPRPRPLSRNPVRDSIQAPLTFRPREEAGR